MTRFAPSRLARIARAHLRRAFGEVDDRLWKGVSTEKVTVGSGCVDWRTVRWEGANRAANGCWFSGSVSVGYGTRFSTNCIVSGPLEIGRYCSIGGLSSLGAGSHPLETAAMYNGPPLFGGKRRRMGEPDEPSQIGHDVWIGAGARIMAGVQVGDGAVIAANAVVTKDVAPFSIVAGIPARPVRMRFEPEVAALVQELAWWDLAPDQLAEFEAFLEVDLTRDTETAVAALRDAIARREALAPTL